MSAAHGSKGFSAQQRLPLLQPQPRDLASFIPSSCNAEARAALEAWSSWPGGKLALVGPEGSGKSHLATAWAQMVGAEVVGLEDSPPSSLAPPRATVLEDADRRPADETLFHLIERADANAPLLMTARAAPRAWSTDLPDLRSRLNALMVVELLTPDDAVLEGMLDRLFRERNIRAKKAVLDYLVRRIERSAKAAKAVVERLDEAAAAEGRNITPQLAREVLGLDSGDLDSADEEPE
ncbi:MAG TPA: chromosomal replication initiator DnaA [Caulobacteraceae bacterium]